MKKICYSFLAFAFLSCNTEAPVKTETTNNPVKIAAEKSGPIPEKVQPVAGSKEKLQILLPSTYRDWEGKYPVDILTKDWIELYRKNGHYYLDKVDYRIEKGVDECSGSDIKTIISKRDVVLLMDLPSQELGEIQALKIRKSKIWPNEKTSFQYNGVDYFLRAEGEILSGEITSDENRFHDVKNYKLYISTSNTAEVLFLEQESFNDTFVELLFVGDIDQDGKLDFIVDADRNYEEDRAILFLSSKAKAGGIVQKVAEIAIQFDC